MGLKEIKWVAPRSQNVKPQRRDFRPWIRCSEHYATLLPISHFHGLATSSRVLSLAEAGVHKEHSLNRVQPPFLSAQARTWENSPTSLFNLSPVPAAANSVTATEAVGFSSSLPPFSPTSHSSRATEIRREAATHSPSRDSLFISVPFRPWFQTGNP